VFKSLGIRHSFITPASIFCTPQSYKLNDIGFMSGQTEYKRFLLGLRESCYLSPQLFEELGYRAVHPVHVYEKSEVHKSHD
jgi:hypothetical protein